MDKTAKFLHIAPSIQTNTDALEVVNHTHTHTHRGQRHRLKEQRELDTQWGRSGDDGQTVYQNTSTKTGREGGDRERDGRRDGAERERKKLEKIREDTRGGKTWAKLFPGQKEAQCNKMKRFTGSG